LVIFGVALPPLADISFSYCCHFAFWKDVAASYVTSLGFYKETSDFQLQYHLIALQMF